MGSSFGPQPPFDPAAKLALPAAIAQARTQLSQAAAALARAQATRSDAQHAVDGFVAQTRGLSARDRARFARALKARQLLTEQAIAAYVQGGSSSAVGLLGTANPSDLSVGMAMLDSVLEQLEVQSKAYASDRAALSGPLRARLDQGTRITADLASAESSVATATLVVQAAQWQLLTFQNASHVWVPGFVFPVEGPTTFTDTFGDPRLSGTSEQHWHEGCDVMAASGTPLVAVEDGVLGSYGGSDPLGGLSLSLQGASGYTYYYAHLSAFVPGLAQGDTVTAGEVVGYVGSTGDALAPHLHFEIHESGGPGTRRLRPAQDRVVGPPGRARSPPGRPGQPVRPTSTRARPAGSPAPPTPAPSAWARPSHPIRPTELRRPSSRRWGSVGQTGAVDLLVDLDAPCAADVLFANIDDLAEYPGWLEIVERAEVVAADPADDGDAAWLVDLRGRLGPLARSKRLRMVRTACEAPYPGALRAPRARRARPQPLGPGGHGRGAPRPAAGWRCACTTAAGSATASWSGSWVRPSSDPSPVLLWPARAS